jgi:hypothetical protein
MFKAEDGVIELQLEKKEWLLKKLTGLFSKGKVLSYPFFPSLFFKK